ncbi:MAG: hypothetical protein GY906_14225 [bacterium]|nr:hypothetical protein [bacterium]
MAEAIRTQEIQATHQNLYRMAEYLSQRVSWSIPYNADTPLQKIRSLIASLNVRVDSLLSGANADGNAQTPVIGFEPLPSASFDGDKLYRFAGFLEDLERWFTTRSGFEDATTQTQILLALKSSLVAMEEATTEIWEKNHPEEADARPDSVASTASATSPSHTSVESIVRPPVSDSDSGSGSDDDDIIEPVINLKLVLENTVENPLLQEFKGRVEMTGETHDTLNAFLVEAKAEMKENDQRRFEEKVVRWIEGTPEGQVLILKSGAFDGPYKLYPLYRHRDDVQQ